MSYSDLMLEVQKEEEKQRRAATWAAVAGTINASNAAYSTQTTYNSGNTYGSYNSNSYGTYGNKYQPYTLNTTGNYSGTYSGVSTTRTYDPAKAQMLANQNSQNLRNNLNQIAASAQTNRQLLDQLIMKAQTIRPGEGYGGLVVTNTRNFNHRITGSFEIVVKLDNEEHKFIVNRSYHEQ